MIEFKRFLEDADFEVSIELHPVTSVNTHHYQIYKPKSSTRHCWEVYRNPNKSNEIEVRIDCDTLDEAIACVVRDSEERVERFKRMRDAYMALADVTCDGCLYKSNGDCKRCEVRKTMDWLDGKER